MYYCRADDANQISRRDGQADDANQMSRIVTLDMDFIIKKLQQL